MELPEQLQTNGLFACLKVILLISHVFKKCRFYQLLIHAVFRRRCAAGRHVATDELSIYGFGVLASIRHWFQRHHSDAVRALSRTRVNARWSPDFVHDQLAHGRRLTRPSKLRRDVSASRMIISCVLFLQEIQAAPHHSAPQRLPSGTSGTELTKIQEAAQPPRAVSRTSQSPRQLRAIHNKIDAAPFPYSISRIFFAGEPPGNGHKPVRRASPLDRPFKRSPSEQPLRVFLGSSAGPRSMWAGRVALGRRCCAHASGGRRRRRRIRRRCA
jgi:hypothetical protein